MNYDILEQGNKLKKDIKRISKQLANINYSLSDANKQHSESWQERFFAKFGRFKDSYSAPEREEVLIFTPGRIMGTEVDLDLDFILLLKGYLERKVKKLEKEFKELGCDEKS